MRSLSVPPLPSQAPQAKTQEALWPLPLVFLYYLQYEHDHQPTGYEPKQGTRGSSAHASGGGNSGHESDSADANSDTASNSSTNPPPDEDQSHLLSSDDSSSNSSRDSDNTSSSSSDCSSSSDSGCEKKRKRSSKKKKSSKRNHDRRSAQHNSNLEVPKLTGADDYELWRTMIELKLKVQKLWSLVTEETAKKDSWSSRRKRRWEARWLKAQETIAGSLGPRLAGRYRRLLVNCDPVLLFQEIEKEYNAGSAAKNDILIKGAMFARKLTRGERVDTYIDAVMKLQEDLVTLGFALEDSELARLLLTNALEVFPDLSNELVGARLKRTVLEVGRVRGRLLVREQEENMRGPQGSHNPMTFQAGNPSAPAHDGSRVLQLLNDHSPTRPHDNRGGKPTGRRFPAQQGHRRSFRSGMDRRPCAICNQLGHWYGECPRNNGQSHHRGRHSDHRNNGRGGRFRSGGRAGRQDQDATGPLELMVSMEAPSDCSVREGTEWCLDSGAQVNICSDLSCFTEVSTVCDGRVMRCANGSSVNVNQIGSVELFVVNERTGRREQRILPDVYYVPGAVANLISLDYMQSRLDYFLSMAHDQSACFMTKHAVSLKFEKVDGIYRIWSVRPRRKQCEVVCNAILRPNNKRAKQPMTVWHKRFAHASTETILHMVKQQAVRGLKSETKVNEDHACLPCIKGKTVRMTYKERRHRAKKPLQRFQVDVCTVNESTVEGFTAFLLVVDEYSRYKWLFLLKHKSEAKPHIIALVNRLHIKYRAKHWRVEEIHSDQGGEFDNTDLHEFGSLHGIAITTTNGYTPQENGIVERANGMVLPKLRSLLHMTNLPDSLWGEAALHVVHTLNVTATRVLQGRTPHELLSGERPDVSWLRTWGSLCYYHIASGSRKKKEKLSSRMGTAVLVGYSPSTNGYKVLDLESGGVSTHRGGNLVWAEDYTVGREYIEKLLANAYSHGDHQLPARAPLVPMQMQIEDVVRLDSVKESVLVRPGPTVAATQPVAEQLPRDEPVTVTQHGNEPTAASGAAPGEHDTVARHQVSRFGRKRKRNTRFNGFELNFVAPSKNRRKLQVPRYSLDPHDTSRLHARDVPIPRTYRMAMRSLYAAYWKAAMDEELESLRRHGVWIVVDRNSAGKAAVITNRWVFAVKKDEQGFVKRFKARLVIHGFKQRYGVDFNETFAPVIRFDTIRAAVYYAVQRGWMILQYDVKTAFLHATLSEVVFMELPQGSGAPCNTKICRLIKSLYGLKQAPHVWNKTLHRHLVALGFVRLESDHGLYALHEQGGSSCY